MRHASIGDAVGIQQLATSLVQAAELAATYPEYLCLYERLEREYLLARDGQSVLERALAIASGAIPTVRQIL